MRSVSAGRCPRRGPAGSRGAAAVEFALLLPLLAMLVLGGVDWGYYFFVAQIAHNAAREGARAGTLHSSAGAATADAQATAESYLTRAGLDLGQADIDVTVTADTSQVDITFSLDGIIGLVPVPGAARATAQMRR